MESDKGGILSAGKLTAHVEARGVRGQEFSVQRSGSVNLPSFLTPSPSSFVPPHSDCDDHQRGRRDGHRGPRRRPAESASSPVRPSCVPTAAVAKSPWSNDWARTSPPRRSRSAQNRSSGALLAAGARRKFCPPDRQAGISENVGAGPAACGHLAQIDWAGNHRGPVARDRRRRGHRAVSRGVPG